MKKMTNKLILPAMRLILLISMSSPFLSIADADHDSPSYINVWIEAGGDSGYGSTMYEHQYVTVCCGEPEELIARTSLLNPSKIDWYGATKVTSSSGYNASVVHNLNSPQYVTNTTGTTMSSKATIVAKSLVNDHSVYARAYSNDFSPFTNHHVKVTSVGTRFFQFDEGTSDWAGVAPNVDWNQNPYYVTVWEQNGEFNLTTRLNAVPIGREWELWKKSSSGPDQQMPSAAIINDSIDFSEVYPGSYRVVLKHTSGLAKDLGCLPELDLDIIDLNIEASEYAYDGSVSSGAPSLPWQLAPEDKEPVGMKVAVNNDDDNENGVPDMRETGEWVLGERDSASVRITFPGIDEIVSGKVSLELTGPNQFGRLWTSRIHKISDNLLLAKTSGTTVAPAPENANVGFLHANWGSNKQTWDLSNSTQKEDFKTDVLNEILWFEGLSSGTGSLRLVFHNAQGKEVFEDVLKITVLTTKTLAVKVGYSDAVKYANFGAITNTTPVRNYHGTIGTLPEDVMLPVAFMETDFVIEDATFDQIKLGTLGEFRLWNHMQKESIGIQVYVVNIILNEEDNAVWGVAKFEYGSPMFIIRENHTIEGITIHAVAIHEYGHNVDLEHKCAEQNFMFGDCTTEWRGNAILVEQDQYNKVMQ